MTHYDSAWIVWRGDHQPWLSLQGAPSSSCLLFRGAYSIFVVCQRESIWWPTDFSIHSLIYSFNKDLLSTCCVLSLVSTLRTEKLLAGYFGWNGKTGLKELEENSFLLRHYPSTPTFEQKHTSVELSFPVFIHHFLPFSSLLLLKLLSWVGVLLPCLPGCDNSRQLNFPVWNSFAQVSAGQAALAMLDEFQHAPLDRISYGSGFLSGQKEGGEGRGQWGGFCPLCPGRLMNSLMNYK